jgi:hypothetical protein
MEKKSLYRFPWQELLSFWPLQLLVYAWIDMFN